MTEATPKVKRVGSVMDFTDDWHGCYDGSWKDVIVPEAFAHPAKYAFGLITRIIKHGMERGWWKPGDVIGDCFGGIGTGGIVASAHGLRWIGVELEPRFVTLAEQNFAKARAASDPVPVIIQGDSREFAKLVGDVDAVVTSPPYAESIKGEHGETETAAESRNKRSTPGGSLGQSQRHGGYGGKGNIGNLRSGTLDGCVTSPPYGMGDSAGPESLNRRTDPSAAAMVACQGWASGGQVSEGNLACEKDDTYWQACAAVYQQVHQALKPGGVFVLVVKSYVKKGKRVPLPDQTAELLERLGFEPLERIRAWLVKEETHAGLFGDVTVKKERKSFFRRLAEKKGSPPIDWEEVIVVRKLAITAEVNLER